MTQRLADTLADRAGKDPDAERVATAMVSICEEISAALSPILGQQGVTALYERSVYRAAVAHPWLAVAGKGLQTPLGVEAFRPVFAQQSSDRAAAGGVAFLTAFSELLSSLIGLALAEQLLQSIWKTRLNSASTKDISS